MDDDDDFMQDSDPEQYDFEYEDDDDDDDPTDDVNLENKYYNAKQIKATSPEEALEEFLGVPAQEAEKGNWGFKGLKQAIKLEFTLRRYDKALEHYCELLTYVRSAVTRNYSEKSINSLLDHVEKASDNDVARQTVEHFYSNTLESFRNSNNERLWLKTNLKLARLWLDRGMYEELIRKVRDLHRACQDDDGADDPNKGTYSLEIYAIEIQMYSVTKNNKRLKTLYQKALRVRSAIPHPKVMGIIRECGGKMHMSEENWKAAQVDFFEAFRNYDEAGSLQRIQVLKYLVLTTMLVQSLINPFDSPETKPYKNDPRISAMTDLVDVYQRDDLHRYEQILRANLDLLSDPFIAENIDEVTRNIRSRAMLRLVKPYKRFGLGFAALKLDISVDEATEILAGLIIEGSLEARIDQAGGIVTVVDELELPQRGAVHSWNTAVQNMTYRMFAPHEGDRGDGQAIVSSANL
ncbi:MAG: hypothetical protein M1815_001765 [Lichina confinis]|nr:MAG: hypothetical protein M1815_001765 [Lichina confinis]